MFQSDVANSAYAWHSLNQKGLLWWVNLIIKKFWVLKRWLILCCKKKLEHILFNHKPKRSNKIEKGAKKWIDTDVIVQIDKPRGMPE